MLASRWRPSHGSKVWVRPLGGRGGPETAAHGRCGRWRDEESHSECGQRLNLRAASLSVNKRLFTDGLIVETPNLSTPYAPAIVHEYQTREIEYQTREIEYQTRAEEKGKGKGKKKSKTGTSLTKQQVLH